MTELAIPDSVRPWAGRIVDADAHEMLPLQVWGALVLARGTEAVEHRGVARLRASLDHEAFMPRHERLIYLIAALAANGQEAEAAALAADTSARYPEYGLSWFAGRAQSEHPAYRAQFVRILDQVRAAGLRE